MPGNPLDTTGPFQFLTFFARYLSFLDQTISLTQSRFSPSGTGGNLTLLTGQSAYAMFTYLFAFVHFMFNIMK